MVKRFNNIIECHNINELKFESEEAFQQQWAALNPGGPGTLKNVDMLQRGLYIGKKDNKKDKKKKNLK